MDHESGAGIGGVEMICSVGELASLFRRGQDMQGFLTQVVETVSHHMQTDSCAVFLYDGTSNRLVLRAAAGVFQDLVGNFSISPEEGLTGLAFRELQPVWESDNRSNPHYKLVPGSGEDVFESLLAVPIVRGLWRVGALVLQDKTRGRFGKTDAQALKAIASQLATALENAQLFMDLARSRQGNESPEISSSFIRGTPVVEGVCMGEAYPSMQVKTKSSSLWTVTEGSYRETLQDFRQAIDKTEQQLEVLQSRLEEELADVASLIFSAHLLMLRDSSYAPAMEKLIEEGSLPKDAVEQITNQFISLFSRSENPRMQEKVLDMKDLGHRILKNLQYGNDEQGDYTGQIFLTDELLPSVFLKLAAQNVEGVVLLGGGAAAHITILARSLQVPVVFTEDETLRRIPPGTYLALDAYQGNLIVSPDDVTRKRLLQHREGSRNLEEQAGRMKPETFTVDGERIYLRASINLLSDLKLARSLKAEGIGLYRSEFPFLVRSDFPNEEEQYNIYRKVVNGTDNPVVVLRTLDVGGDKILSYLPDAREEANPFLGLRAIRFLLENKKVFVSQLKAMIRAGGEKSVRILFPLISSVDEFLDARRMVEKSMGFLERDGLGRFPMPSLGAMIELPSAVEMAEELAREADFLSLGTNDLVQYMLGVDRTNESVADLFDTNHPAVLRAVKRVADAAREARCPLSVCGIMAKNPQSVYYLTGLGIRSFSMEPGRLPLIQEAVGKMDSAKAVSYAQTLSSLGTLTDVRQFIKDSVSF